MDVMDEEELEADPTPPDVNGFLRRRYSAYLYPRSVDSRLLNALVEGHMGEVQPEC